MATTDLTDVRTTLLTPDLLPAPGNGGYLDSLNLYRVLACLTVVGQHSFLWTGMSGNVIGTGFITILHLSRNSFFFLTGLVLCYSQLVNPRPLLAFWRRRYVQLGVPYLAWTAIYLVFAVITISASWNEVGTFLYNNIIIGYYQLYALIVIFQFYFVAPLLLRLLHKTRHHGVILVVSLAFATFLGLFLHNPTWWGPLTNVNHWMGTTWPWSRDLLSYQEYFVAGALVAYHLDDVYKFVARFHRAILLGTVAIGGLTVGLYAHSVSTGTSVERASDIYQPTAVLWSLTAIAGMFTLSWMWEQRAAPAPGSPTRRALPSVAYLASLTGGIFLSHVLFINMIRAVLGHYGLRTDLPWEAIVSIIYISTALVAATFVALVLRTPLRWVLGGPVRAEQRVRYNELATSRVGSLTHPAGLGELAKPRINDGRHPFRAGDPGGIR